MERDRRVVLVKCNNLLIAHMCKTVVDVVAVLLSEGDAECEKHQASLVVMLCLHAWNPVEQYWSLPVLGSAGRCLVEWCMDE